MRLGAPSQAVRKAPKRPLKTCSVCHSRLFTSCPALRSTNQQETTSATETFFKAWDASFPEVSQWKARLREALAGNSKAQARKFTRIAVLGTRTGGSEALVSALVQDPLHPDFLVTQRWAHRPLQSGLADEPLLLSPDAGIVSNGISTPSTWLANNRYEILEFRPDTASALPDSMLAAILSADQVLLAFSDVDSPEFCARLLEELKDHPSLVVTCNGLLSSDPSDFKQQISDILHTAVLPFDSKTAQSATNVISNGADLAQYSRHLTESRVPSIADALLECKPSTSSSSAEYVLTSALQRLQDIARSSEVLSLHLQVQQNSAKASLHQILEDLHLLAPSAILTPESRDQSRSAFQYALQKRLAWWKLPFGRADDVMAELGQAAQVAWRKPESDALFAAGRLDGLRQDLEAKAQPLLLTQGLQQGLHLAVLQNQADQLVESGQTRISNENALAPFEQRRRQVVGPAGLAEAAYRSTQNVVLGNYLLLVGTSAASYMSVLSEVAQWPTAATGGVFGLVFASWRLQKGWEKVKRRFMGNLERLNDGLEEDLKEFVKTSGEKTNMKQDLLVNGLLEADRQRQAQVAFAASVLEARRRELTASQSIEP